MSTMRTRNVPQDQREAPGMRGLQIGLLGPPGGGIAWPGTPQEERSQGFLTTRRVWIACTRLTLLRRPITYRGVAKAARVDCDGDTWFDLVATVWQHLRTLQEAGYITGIDQGKPRKSGTIRVVVPIYDETNGRIVRKN